MITLHKTNVNDPQLRQGQSYCTDSECLEELPGLPPAAAGNSFMVLFLMMAVAMLMYALRPRRNQIEDAAKPGSSFQVSIHVKRT